MAGQGVPGAHHLAGLAGLAVLPRAVRGRIPGRRVLGRRRRGTVAVPAVVGTPRTAGPRTAAVDAQVVHALAELPRLQLSEAFLEELEVPPPVPHLTVELGADGIVVGLLSHQMGRVDQSLLPIDLLADVGDLLVFVHGCRSSPALRRGGALLRERRCPEAGGPVVPRRARSGAVGCEVGLLGDAPVPTDDQPGDEQGGGVGDRADVGCRLLVLPEQERRSENLHSVRERRCLL